MWSINRFVRGRSALLRPQKCSKSRSRACKSFLRMVEARSYTRKSTGNALGPCASHLTKGRNAFLHPQRCWRSHLHTLKMFTTISIFVIVVNNCVNNFHIEIVVNKLCQQFPYWNCDRHNFHSRQYWNCNHSRRNSDQLADWNCFCWNCYHSETLQFPQLK